MDDTVNQKPISDDQELAKVLAGVSQQADTVNQAPVMPSVPPLPTVPPMPPASDPTVAPVVPTPVASEPVAHPTTHGSGELDSIKLEALNELRPLVDKLDVPADEKFDTYLLLLRSTDDKSLIAPAHEAAKAITDEARRAQALLDIIKEIDFLSQSRR